MERAVSGRQRRFPGGGGLAIYSAGQSRAFSPAAAAVVVVIVVKVEGGAGSPESPSCSPAACS